MVVKCRTSEASRVRFQVVLRVRMSTSPACSAAKRCCELSGTNSAFLGSPSTAAAIARQVSTSRPDQLPCVSGAEKPATPLVTPHLTVPRALTASRVLPAWAGAPDRAVASNAAAAARKLGVRMVVLVNMETAPPQGARGLVRMTDKASCRPVYVAVGGGQ